MISDASTVTREASKTPRDNPGFETTICWHCGSSEFDLRFNAHVFENVACGYDVVRCRHCGLHFTAGVSEDILRAAYSASYYGSAQAKFLAAVEMLVRAGQNRQARKIIDRYYAGRPASNARLNILDVGCGRGLLLQAFARLGARCLGIERDEFPGADAEDFDIHIGSLEDEALADSRFDIIVIWHVLEHVTALGELLQDLPRHLADGGLLVISVPNFSSWQSRFFRQHWFHLDIPRHVSHFEASWLVRKLESMGLEVRSRSTFCASQNIFGFVQSGLNRLFPRQPNRLYRLLSRSDSERNWMSLPGWLLLALPLFPLALLESLFAEFAGRGATLTLYARKAKETSSDSQAEDA